MPDITPRLGLELPLGNELNNRENFRKNFERMEQVVETMAGAQEKADAAYEAAEALFASELSDAAAKPLTLLRGVHVYQVDRDGPLKNMSMTGRTLVNLLGRAGNCEDITKVLAYGSNAISSITEDTTNFAIGTKSIKATIASGTFGGISFSIPNGLLKENTNYLAVAMVKVVSGSLANIIFGATPNILYQMKKQYSGGPTTGFIPIATRVLASNETNFSVNVVINGTVGDSIYIDAVRMYEVTTAEASDLNTMTADQIADRYPYVDDIKHVDAVYVHNPGKNLLPPFTEWFNNIPTKLKVTEPYKAVVTGSEAWEGMRINIPVRPNQHYAFSFSSGAYLIQSLDEFGVPIQSHGWLSTPAHAESTVFPAHPAAMFLQVLATTGPDNGDMNFERPMLNIGSSVLPFEPQKRSYVYLPHCTLQANEAGSVSDRLYADGTGKLRVLRRFREVILDGAVPWEWGGDGTGYKKAKTLMTNVGVGYYRAVKYDGKILKRDEGTSSADTVALFHQGIGSELANYLYIQIDNAESGWGASWGGTTLSKSTYTSLTRDATAADLMKAYFNGWKMINFGSPSTTGWQSMYSETRSWNVDEVISQYAPGFETSYRLMYQLDQSVDEPVAYEGELFLHEGANQIEVGTGIVVREPTTPAYYSPTDEYVINNINPVLAQSLLKFRTKTIDAVFMNGDRDGVWYHTVGTPYGLFQATTRKINFDPTAAYSVTYRALDTYLIGIAPQTVVGDYAPNIKETVDDLARSVAEAKTDISVLRNTKAQKQPPQWIAPTLLNGWIVDQAVGYIKDEGGFVVFKGVIKSGTTTSGTILFNLPAGYRPKEFTPVATVSGSGSSTVIGRISFETNGQVQIRNGGNTFLVLNGIRFRAEQ